MHEKGIAPWQKPSNASEAGIRVLASILYDTLLFGGAILSLASTNRK
jgi:hypothetical protein